MNKIGKKNRILCLGMAVTVLLSACTAKKETAEAVEISEDSIQTVMETAAQDLLNADWTSLREMFCSELLDSVSEDDLKSGAAEVLDGLSDGKLDHTEVILSDEKRQGYAFITYSEKTVKLFLQLDTELKAERIILNEVKTLPELSQTDTYSEQAVSVGYHPAVSGILTLPVGVDNPPVVILVGGSGSTDCNETIEGNKPFEDIAHGLAEQGIATLRYDKRYYDYPELIRDNSEADLDQEYFQDIAAAVHMLENYPVDATKIYYCGHSEGAMLAYSAAYQHFEIHGMILLAGTARGMEDLVVDQTENYLKSQGLDTDTVNTQTDTVRAAADQIKALTEDTAGTDEILGIGSHYWYQLNQANAQNYIDKVSIPTLILQGEDDTQVFYETDYALWEELLKGKADVTMKSYPGLNHLFMDSTLQPEGNYTFTEHVSTEVIQDIADWIQGKKIDTGD